jgi:hypothetical protein
MKGHWIEYSRRELAFIQRHCTLPRSELHARFVKRFGRKNVSVANLHALCKRNGWMTGRDGRLRKGNVPHNKDKKCPPGAGGRHPNARKTQFKRGNLPHNTKFEGHERISKDGYVEISVAERNPHTGFERRHVLKHRWLWEKQHGRVPPEMALKCLSDDKTNCDPSNWELVPRALLPRLNGGRHKKRVAYDDAPAEIKPTIMAVAKLEHHIRKAVA